MAFLEKELVSRVRALVADEYHIFEEVGFYNRCIDMVLLASGQVTTVEFKIKDWRKALKQIRDHQVIADFSYLCMPKRKVAEELLEALRVKGIGLWLYDDANNTLDEFIQPREAPYKWDFYNASFIRMLNERGNAENAH